MTLKPATTKASDARHRLIAIGLMVLASVCFAALDATAKYLVDETNIPVAQVTWLRFATHVLFSAVVLWPFAFRPSLRSAKPMIQMVRSCFMIATTVLNFIAHPILALRAGGYFPGLLTAPVVGVLGVLAIRELERVTAPQDATRDTD